MRPTFNALEHYKCSPAPYLFRSKHSSNMAVLALPHSVYHVTGNHTLPKPFMPSACLSSVSSACFGNSGSSISIFNLPNANRGNDIRLGPRAAKLATNKKERAKSKEKNLEPPPTNTLGLQIVETMELNSKVRLSVTVPARVCQDGYNKMIGDLGKKFMVPGFRPGKIPLSILVNAVGQDRINSAALEIVLKKTLPEAMSSVAGRALKESERIVTKFEDLEASFNPSTPLSYEVVVDVAPEVKWVTENAYKTISIEVEVADDSSIMAAADGELHSRHKDLGSLRVVTGRGIQMGDVAIVDISAARINTDGSLGDKILSCEQKGFQLDTEEGSTFLPGFVDAILGLDAGQGRDFDLTFPQTWQQEALRGINARFTAHCREIFYRTLPDLDDSMAGKLHEGATSLSQVKEMLLDKYKVQAEEAKKQATRSAVIQELAKIAVVDIPNSLLEEQGRQMYAAKLIELQASGKLSKDQVVSLSSAEMVNNYLRAQKDVIADSVKQSLAAAEIFKLEKLEYTAAELDKEVKDAIAEFKRYNQEYDEAKVKEQAKEMLEGLKTTNWLIEHSEINYVTKGSK